MSVEETKKLILKRLDELREIKTTRPAPAPAEAPLPDRPTARTGRRRRRWFDRPAKARPNNVELRLEKLEDRLMAMERFLIDPCSPEDSPGSSRTVSVGKLHVFIAPMLFSTAVSKVGFDTDSSNSEACAASVRFP